MAEISVNGWIAEGGHTTVKGNKNIIILFDVIEDAMPINGIDDVFNNNNAWYHCNFEINIDQKEVVSFIPPGHTINRIESNGRAILLKEGTKHEWSLNDMFLTGEQVADYIQEGKRVCVKGRIFLLKGADDKILKVIDVSDLWFELLGRFEKPKLLKVPYRYDLYLNKTYPQPNETPGNTT